MAGSDGREAFAALAAAVAQRGAAGLGGFASEKSVLAFPAHFRWLILAFHKLNFAGSASKTPSNGARENNNETPCVKAGFEAGFEAEAKRMEFKAPPSSRGHAPGGR